MSPFRRFRLAAAAGLVLALVPTSVRAVIFVQTGDPTYNTTAPGGALAGSGWQYSGDWGPFGGTPVAPQYFITAKHVGGNVGQTFIYNGVTYTTTERYDIGTTDVRVFRISGTFPTYAPMYTTTDVTEIGQKFVAVGRGTQRGPEVIHQSTGDVKGWTWGAWDQVRRWGENKINAYGDVAQKLMLFNFDLSGPDNVGANEMTVSMGDSGGGVFIKVGSTWKLAGIMSGVSGAYSYTSDPLEPRFNAALYDRGGFYDWAYDPPQQVTDLPTNQPGFGVLSRIASNLSSINGVMTGPPVWNVNSNGNWSTGGNWWKGVSPNGVGAEAILGNIITAPRTVTLDVNRIVGTLTLDSPHGYTVSALGGSTLTINSATNSAVNVNAGSHTIAAPVILATNTAFNVLPANSTLALTGTLTATNVTVTKTGAGTLQVKNVRASGLVINGGKVSIVPNGGSAGVVNVGTLGINNDGALDLADNDLVVQYSGSSPFQQKFDEVIEGYSATPNPSLTGIVSSTSQANGGRTILALFDNAFFGVTEWPPGSGLIVPTQSVIGKYTYFGDANLDGQVTGDDYTVIDSNLNTTPAVGAGWTSGDVNLDGIVTGDDYTTIDSNLGLGVGNALSPAALSSNLNAVPEPAGVTMLLVAALPLIRRRRGRYSFNSSAKR